MKPQATLAQDLTGRISWPSSNQILHLALVKRLESAQFFIRADLRVIRYYNTSTRISNTINVGTNGLNFFLRIKNRLISLVRAVCPNS